jgi:hypothetical protein
MAGIENLILDFGNKTMVSPIASCTVKELFHFYRVPGDGSCFYSAVACGLIHREDRTLRPLLDDALKGGRWLRKALAQHIESEVSVSEKLKELGEDPAQFLNGVLGNDMADEPAISELMGLLKLPLLVFEALPSGKAVKGYLIGAADDPTTPLLLPLAVWRSNEHYDALLPRNQSSSAAKPHG